jgi:uncharacterized protein YfaS (alpha-2-macroglobulin family)
MNTRNITLIAIIFCTSIASFFYAQATLQPNRLTAATIEAIKAKDTPQLIEVLIQSLALKLEQNQDNYPLIIEEVRNYAATCKDEAAQALLHSMVAELYERYYTSNSWKINKRTEIAGAQTEDIQQWSSTVFADTIAFHLNQSLRPQSLLKRTPLSNYKTLLQPKGDDQIAHQSLYEFLLAREVRCWKSLSVNNYQSNNKQAYQQRYQQSLATLINNQKETHQQEAALHSELTLQRSLYDWQRGKRAFERYTTALDSLANLYANDSLIVNIVAAQLDIMPYAPDVKNPETIFKAMYQLAKKTTEAYPNSSRIGLVKNKLNELMQPTLIARFDKQVTPEQVDSFHITRKNIEQVKIQLFDLNATPRKLYAEYLYPLTKQAPYVHRDTVLTLPKLPLGSYACEITAPQIKDTIKQTLIVSHLFVAKRKTPNDIAELLVTDITSGKPIANADVLLYTQQRYGAPYIYTSSVKSNALGLAALPNQKEIKGYKVIHKADSAKLIAPRYHYTNNSTKDDTEKERIQFFTDRNLYRPGQTLFFKGIVHLPADSLAELVTNKTYTIVLKDRKRKTIAEQQLITNSYGSFNGSFAIPKDAEAGSYSIQCKEKGAIYVKVAAYKRPSFKVVLAPITEALAFGDAVTLKGEAITYSGIPLQGAKFSYHITRIPYNMYGSSGVPVAAGNGTTNAAGNMHFSFVPDSLNEANQPIHGARYSISVTVTDSKGETEEGEIKCTIGKKRFDLRSSFSRLVDKDKTALQIDMTNANGKAINGTGTYTLYQCTEKNDTILKRSGSFVSGKPVTDAKLQTLPSARYILKMQAVDSQGELITDSITSILYSVDDKRPPVQTTAWMIPETVNCDPSEEGVIYFGTSLPTAYLLYEVMDSRGIISQKRMKLHNEIKQFKIPYAQIAAKGTILSFTFVADGMCYNEQVVVRRKTSNRKLNIQTTSFTNRITANSNTHWKFRITQADGTPARAEALAWMYDASLDALYNKPIQFTFDALQLNANYHFTPTWNNRASSYIQAAIPHITVLVDTPKYLNWQGILKQVYTYGATGIYRSKGAVASNEVLAEAEVYSSASDAAFAVNLISMRSNWSENAFFYPTLQTDSAGYIAVDFVTPSSNTTWKLNIVAHTKELFYGDTTLTAVARKHLMIAPNLPTFVRTGDVVTWSAQVTNASETSATGTARFELLNPADQKPIAPFAPKPFELKAGETTAVSWQCTIPAGVDSLICRYTAQTATDSDGEMHRIAVWSDEVTLTESHPFVIPQAGDTTIVADFNAADTRRTPISYTLDYTNNPTWYAVQALPTLTVPRYANAVSWFAAYYSSTLLIHLAATTPQVKEEKNIDITKLKALQAEARRSLGALQTHGGGWSWYAHMPADPTITTYILQGMAQLTALGAIEYNNEEKMMQIAALKYMDKHVAARYETARKKQPHITPALTPQLIAYLYTRSSYRDIPEHGEARTAIRHYTRLAAKEWTKQPLMDKAYTAALLARNGNAATANAIIKHLRAIATHSASRGMYWANNRFASGSFATPTTIHCQVMATLQEVSPNATEQTALKTWLLTQKQTVDWNTLPATAQAIYILLSTQTPALTSTGTSRVVWGAQVLASSPANQGAGNIRITIQSPTPNPAWDTLHIQKTSTNPAWGALFHTYKTPINAVKAQGDALTIAKTLFIHTNNGTQELLQPITEAHPLRVGDKVTVRLTLTAARTFSYVHVTDPFAASTQPTNFIATHQQQDGINYYQAPTDTAQNLFINRLPQGSYTFTYDLYITRQGTYTGGVTQVECLYAPAFRAHTAGALLSVEQQGNKH